MPGLIAIVGRPNVGKSALFNRIAGKRIAIVHDQPGVTRDRVTAEVEWHGRPFTLVDTGGIGLVRGEKAADVITEAAFQQVELAIAAADVIILVVNIREGVVPLDREVAQRLRRAGKEALVAVNKTDNDRDDLGAGEFSELGFAKIFPVSAIHQRGIDALMDAALAALPPETETGGVNDAGEPPLKLAVVGRPNVGKSSLINALTQSKRVIVTPIPGTTRDAVDVPFTVETEGVRQNYILIDTAGVRQHRRIDDSVEFFSVKRTEDSIGRCDIVIFVLDAEAGILGQDKKVADTIIEERKACILVINKWDLIAQGLETGRRELRRDSLGKHREGQAKPLTSLAEFGDWVRERLFFLDYAPVIFTSATSGFHLDRLLESVRYVASQLRQKIPTAILNRTLHDAIERRQPVSSAGHRLKFFYATQIKPSPPTFLLFVNRSDLFSDRYKKYLADEMRKAFGFEGCPIILVSRTREKTIDPIRKPKPARHLRQRS
ncbi:MAG TPA: ribosome biogenesis GTPase Der [Candidatus Baltobacteraceae bacterium]|jgi:GTP-binding protein|nr:ribosome biogenesis GTPase Der [Candidatus Baltobacteraceae bacterium]